MKITSYYFMVLDIETSTLKNDKGEPVSTWLSYGYCKLYDRFGDTRKKCYFREWEELRYFLNEMQQKFVGLKLLCFAHNLAYEFDYLIKNLSRPTKFLTNSSHAIISATLEDFPQIEFRCTYRLTMKSLREIGDMVKLPKLDDSYSMILPSEIVPEKRKYYCERDCDIVAKYISDKLLPEFGTFYNAPLTKTGRVRKTYNRYYNEYVKNYGLPCWDIEPPEDCYNAMNDAFCGGIVTSNPMLTGIVLKNVKSKDETSAYPFAQLSELYPYDIVKEENPKLSMLKEDFWIAKIKFNNIATKFNWGWLSVSKMNDYDALTCRFFNGKLISGKSITRTITNVDFESINKTYNYDSLEIIEFYHEPIYGEMPEPYIKTIMEYGKVKGDLKTIMKTIPLNDPNYFDMSIKYMLSKGDFNSIYGMTVQKLLHEEYRINEDFSWSLKPQEYHCRRKHIKRNFLFGVYITAYARKNWITGVVENCPWTFVYGDTDSIKYIGDIEFIDTNKILDEKYLKYDYLKNLGRFEDDGLYKTFVCWGAKKYCYTVYGDKKVYLTVAGLPKKKRDKKATIEYQNKIISKLNTVKEFRLNTSFLNCKMGKKYIYDNITYETDDFENIVNKETVEEDYMNFLHSNNIKTCGGVALFSTSYTLDITENDKRYILENRKYLKKWKEEMDIMGFDIGKYIGEPLEIKLKK